MKVMCSLIIYNFGRFALEKGLFDYHIELNIRCIRAIILTADTLIKSLVISMTNFCTLNALTIQLLHQSIKIAFWYRGKTRPRIWNHQQWVTIRILSDGVASPFKSNVCQLYRPVVRIIFTFNISPDDISIC